MFKTFNTIKQFNSVKITHIKLLIDSVRSNRYKKVQKELTKCIKYKININDIKNSMDNTLLHEAAEYGNVGIVDLILKTNIDINALNKYNETALYTSIKNDNYKIAIILIKKGADIHIADENGHTVIDYINIIQDPVKKQNLLNVIKKHQQLKV
jgi:ankyrin repeat protein